MDNPFAQQQKILLYVFPLIFAVFGVNFPVGVLLYWLTTNLWSMGQQFYVIRRNPAPGSPAAEALERRKAAREARHRQAADGPTRPVGGSGRRHPAQHRWRAERIEPRTAGGRRQRSGTGGATAPATRPAPAAEADDEDEAMPIPLGDDADDRPTALESAP